MFYSGLTPGEECRRFVASYHHDGHWWVVDLYAYDWDDADSRCKKLGLRLDGEFACAIQASAKARPMIQALCSLRNFLWRSS